MNNVTPIRQNPQYVANCPECRCKHWEIMLDSVNDDWENIIGTRCVECGFEVTWIKAA